MLDRSLSLYSLRFRVCLLKYYAGSPNLRGVYPHLNPGTDYLLEENEAKSTGLTPPACRSSVDKVWSFSGT